MLCCHSVQGGFQRLVRYADVNSVCVPNRCCRFFGGADGASESYLDRHLHVKHALT